MIAMIGTTRCVGWQKNPSSCSEMQVYDCYCRWSMRSAEKGPGVTFQTSTVDAHTAEL